MTDERLRFLRARPFAVAGTVALTLLTLVAPTTILDFVLEPASWAGVAIGILVFPALSALVKVVPLTVIAVLAGRRVTPPRTLGVLALSIVIAAAQTGLGVLGVSGIESAEGFVLEVAVFICLGALAAALYPPAAGRDDRRVLVFASVMVAVLSAVRSWLSEPGPDPVPLGGALVRAVIIVGWAIAVLVTSSQVTPESAVQPADQGFKDP